MVSARVFGDVRLERDARAFEEDDFARPGFCAGGPIVRVVETGKVAVSWTSLHVNILEDPRSQTPSSPSPYAAL